MSYADKIHRFRHPGETLPSLGKKWWEMFRRRHWNLSMRRPDSLEKGQAESAKRWTMDSFFITYEKILEESGLREKPRQIYNCGESRFRSDQSKHLVPRGTKHVYQQAPGTREHITVLACLNAAGEDVPPFIIYPKCFPGGHYTQGGPPQALYGESSTGYIDGGLFRKWFQHFLHHAVKERPLLLVFDGHKSHMDLEVLAAAQREGVILLCLPPHSTDVLQPLDVACFGPLKAEFSKVAGDLSQFDNSYIVNKFEFARVFRYPYQRCKDMRFAVEGFKKCGLFPFLMTSKSLLGPSSTSSPATTGGPSAPGPTSLPTSLAAPASSLNVDEHTLLEGGLIAKDLGYILTTLRYQPYRYRRSPVVATCLTREDYTRQWQERCVNERAEAEETERCAALRRPKAQERAAMEETINTIAYAGPFAAADTTPDSGIARTSQCLTPVGPPRAPSCRNRLSACSPGHFIVPPSSPPLPTPAPPAHRRRFLPPSRRTPTPLSISTKMASSAPSSFSVSPGHTASSSVPAPSKKTTSRTQLGRPQNSSKAPPAISVTPPMAPPSDDGMAFCCHCGKQNPPASSPHKQLLKVTWVCCDVCGKLFHCQCVQQDPEVALELGFLCSFCDIIVLNVEI
ncbi:uncharacterized protein LOC105023530 isoform X2 [Esox lucius]|uniref:uncharacterized protein LOC105023530 isoform X2 n=1 Tax=Esox lucius TaxID=8010 RepID=UPI0014770FD2|nr:uncharacterized protein LOC105023530 isoform X2 [Esox lucius]